MPPSTSTPQDAFRVPKAGTWTCRVCQPNVQDQGGQSAFYVHYNRTHPQTPAQQPNRRGAA